MKRTFKQAEAILKRLEASDEYKYGGRIVNTSLVRIRGEWRPKIVIKSHPGDPNEICVDCGVDIDAFDMELV